MTLIPYVNKDIAAQWAGILQPGKNVSTESVIEVNRVMCAVKNVDMEQLFPVSATINCNRPQPGSEQAPGDGASQSGWRRG